MKLIYIAGPYTAPTAFEVGENIDAAKRTAIEVCKLNMNAFPVTPHLNTPFFEGLRDGEYFIDGTFALMSQCHAVLLVLGQNHTNSEGTQGEIKGAKKLGIPVFTALLDLRSWLSAEERKAPPSTPILERIRRYFQRSYSNGYEF